MGINESVARKRRGKRYVQQAVLSAIGAVGILALAAIAPNVIQLLGKIPGNKYKFGYRARTAAGRLAQRGLVRFVEHNGKKSLEITATGKRALAFAEERTALLARRGKRWDKRLRMVIFDIPERRRRTRDQLRMLMQECGFLKVQDSVWLFPYDCEELIALIKAELSLGSHVLYVIVEQIENDGWIRRHFGL